MNTTMSHKKVFKITCEWDVGQDSVVFFTKENARKWMDKNPYLTIAECGDTIERMLYNGVLDIVTLEVIDEP